MAFLIQLERVLIHRDAVDQGRFRKSFSKPPVEAVRIGRFSLGIQR